MARRAEHLDKAYAALLARGGKNGAPLSTSSVNAVHKVLHAALRAARRWRLISENPADDAQPPAPARSKVRAFVSAEVQRLLDAAAATNEELHTIVATLLICGLRRGERLGLARDALDLDAGTIKIKRSVVEVALRPVVRNRAKTEDSVRQLRIPPELVVLLRAQLVRVEKLALQWGREYQRDPLFLFPGLGGRPATPLSLTRRLRRLMHRAGIKGAAPVHAWRHTAATELLDAGSNIKTVQARLGHSSPTITMALYVHPVDERDAEAAAHLGKLISR